MPALTHQTREYETGIPNPSKYNRHFVNTYSLPKSLATQKKPERLRRKIEAESVLELENAYDYQRRGFMGWKLCKVPTQPPLDSKSTAGLASLEAIANLATNPTSRRGSSNPRGRTPAEVSPIGYHAGDNAEFGTQPARISFTGDDFVRRNMRMIREATKSMHSASLSGSLHRSAARSQTAAAN